MRGQIPPLALVQAPPSPLPPVPLRKDSFEAKLIGFGSTVWRRLQTPFAMRGLNLNPLSSSSKDPDDLLRRIIELAGEGLQQAQVKRTELDCTNPFHDKLDRALCRNVPLGHEIQRLTPQQCQQTREKLGELNDFLGEYLIAIRQFANSKEENGASLEDYMQKTIKEKYSLDFSKQFLFSQMGSFDLVYVRYLLSGLYKLSATLENPSSLKPPSSPIDEYLSRVLRSFKVLLDLQGLTRTELKQKIKEMEESDPGILDRKIDNFIIERLMEGCSSLIQFHFQNAELLAENLHVPPNSENSDGPTIINEFRDRYEQLGRLLRRIVASTVSKELEGVKPHVTDSHMRSRFDRALIVAQVTFDQLWEVSEKIECSTLGSMPENNIQPNLVDFLQLMEAFASRREIQDEISELPKVDRDAIWRALTPIYERAEKLTERVRHLQKLQDEYSALSTEGKSSKWETYYDNMQSERRHISKEVHALRNQASQLKLDLPIRLTSTQERIATGIMGGGLGWGVVKLGSFFGPWGAVASASLTALAYVKTFKQPEEKVLVPLAASFLALSNPALAPVIGAASGAGVGLRIKQAFQSDILDKVTHRVQGFIDQGNKLSEKPSFYQPAIGWLKKTIGI
jgi:hypothetical protein